jgi:hypothetical protein
MLERRAHAIKLPQFVTRWMCRLPKLDALSRPLDDTTFGLAKSIIADVSPYFSKTKAQNSP